MALANTAQSSFLGGEISPRAQGRFDLPMYATALNVCLNMVPTEEGAVTRRSGTMLVGPTHQHQPAWLVEYPYAQTYGVVIELTNGIARFISTTGEHMFDNSPHTVSSVTLASPAVVTFGDSPGWGVGDTIAFSFSDSFNIGKMGTLRNRLVSVHAIAGAAVTLYDADNVTPIDSTLWPAASLVGAQAMRVQEVATPYSTTVGSSYNRYVHGVTYASDTGLVQKLLLSALGGAAPQIVSIVNQTTNQSNPGGSSTTDPIFQMAAATFIDGPYLDPVPGSASTFTTWNPADKNANITLSAVAGINNLKATAGVAGSWITARAIDAHASGKWYFEITFANQDVGQIGGLADTNAPLNAFLGSDFHGIGAQTNGQNVWINTSTTGRAWSGNFGGNPPILCIAVDLTAKLIWIGNHQAGATDWNGGTSANPATGTGGYSLATLSSLNVFPAISVNNNLTDAGTINTGSSVFNRAVPSGFTNWGGSVGTTSSFVGTVSGGFGPGSVTVTANAASFAASDVGRCIRIFTQPQAWAAGSTYTYGAQVTDANGAWWQSLAQGTYASSNVNITPGTTPPLASGVALNLWAPAPNAGTWAWGYISSFVSATVVNVNLQTALNSLNSTSLSVIQLGAYSTTTGWPTAGVYHLGRLYLFQANRLDASVPNNPFTFSPTDPNGVVLDNSAISYTLNAAQNCTIVWALPDPQGILLGTYGPEFLISPASANDAITPTSIQVHPVTNYGAQFNSEPVRAGMAALFTHKYGKKVIEYLADAFSGRFTGQFLNKFTQHIVRAAAFVYQLKYQEEPTPIVWVAGGVTGLSGATYQRISRFVTETPVYNAWAQHTIQPAAPGALSLIGDVNGQYDSLFGFSADGASKNYVWIMRQLPREGDELFRSWFLDNSPGIGIGRFVGSATQFNGGGQAFTNVRNGGTTGNAPLVGSTAISFNGLFHLVGKTVKVSILGLYCGSYVVASDGTISVPYQADPDKLLTAAYLIANDLVGNTSGPNSIALDQMTRIDVWNGAATQTVHVPVVIGLSYTSQVQLLRPMAEGTIRSRQGPRLGKVGRADRWTALFSDTAGSGSLSVGTDFTNMYPVVFRQANQTPALASTIFTGVARDTVRDDYSLDTMLAFQMSDPYPITIVSAGVYFQVSEVDE